MNGDTVVNMIKRIVKPGAFRFISALLAACLILTAALPGLGALGATGAGSLSNFDRIRTYKGEFADVAQTAWYYQGVRGAYERGLFDGKSSGAFDPTGSLTLAEAVKIAAVLHKGYHDGSIDFEPGTPWYAPYLEYAVENGIPAGAYRRLNAAATRADFAVLIEGALPDEAITPINRIANGAIPDVFESYSYGQAVYKLYRAGVLTGSGSAGTFFPGRTLTRAEAAIIIMRAVDANSRAPLSLAAELTAEQVYKQASPAVFFVEVLDSEGEAFRSGSGFFISESGLAVTNYHVVVGSTDLRITTDDGTVLDVAGIYDFDRPTDAALIQINGGPFPYLELADSDALLTGATVYSLGSPLGLQASFSKGIVSQARREVDGMDFIQLDAAISSGSSGGALLDSTGRVAGVTCGTMVGAQNINLAVPINAFSKLDRKKYVPVSSIITPVTFYKGFRSVPDFGAHFNMEPFATTASPGEASFSYLVKHLPGLIGDVTEEYAHLAEQNLFAYIGTRTRDGFTYQHYYNSKQDRMLMFGVDKVKGEDCFTVIVF